MFGRLGGWEILIIVVLVVILFGHNKIPGMMKNVANGINVFKKEIKKTENVKDGKVVTKKVATPKKKVAKKK